MGNQTYTIDLDYDPRKADASLAGFRARIISQLTELQTKSANIKLLQGLSDEAVKSERSLSDLRTRAEELKRVLGTLGQGDAGLSKLSTELKSTTAEIKALETSLTKGSKEFNKLTASSAESAVAIQAAFAKVAQLRSAFDGLEKGDAAFKSISASLKVAERDFAKLEATAEKNAARLQDIATASQTANERLRALRDSASTLEIALKKTTEGQVGYATLTANLKAVEKEMRAAEKAAASQTDKLKALELELGLSAKDTAKLANEQNALATALGKAQAAASVQTARSTLGVTGADEARAQVAKLTEAYNVLRKSGTVSVAELTQAKTALNSKIREVQASMEGASRSSANLSTNLLAISAGAVAIGTQLVTAAKAAVAFEQGIARISSISNFTVSQLDALKRQVLELTQRIGIDAPTALAALYEILSAGIPEQNAFKVLESSSKAAIAGVTDINTAAKIGVAVLNSYGLQVSQLDSVYDKLFVTVRDGVTTFPELAQQLGPILPAARLAGVSLNEVSSAMIVLTRAGIPTAEATTAIENAMKSLAAPTVEAAQVARDLGIQYTGLSGTIEQLARKNLSLDVLKTLIPDARGLRAVAALTQSFQLFREEQDAVAKSAGETKKAFDKLAQTPEAQIKKFTASIEALKIVIGEGLLKNTIGFINAASALLKSINELDKGTVALVAQLSAAGLVGGLAVAAAAGVALLPVLGAVTAVLAGTAAAVAGVIVAFNALKEKFATFKVFGDLLGGFLAQGIGQVVEGFNLLSATIRGDVVAQEEARKSIKALDQDWQNFNATTTEARLKIAELEIAQTKLTKSLDDARNAAIAQTAVYATALAPVITAVDEAFNKVTTRVNQAETSVKNFQARLGQAQDANKQLLENSLANIDSALAASVAGVERTLAAQRVTESAGLLKIAQLNGEANSKRLAALSQFSAESIAIVDKENAARIALVKKSNGEESALLAKANLENRQAKIAVLDALRDRYKVYVDGLIAEELRFLDKVKELSEKRREFNLSADEKIRELGRSGLSDYQARNDRLLEIDENLFKARAALNAGNTKQAEEFAKRAIDLAGQTAAAVKGAQGEEISKDQAIAQAQASIIASRELINEAIDREIDSTKAAANAYTRQREVAQAELGKIKAELDAITAAQSGEIKLRISADTKGIDEEITKLRKGIEEQAAIQKVKLTLEDVTRDVATLKKSIEDGLDGVIVRADLTNLKTDVDAAVKALPGVNIKVDDAELKALDLAFTALDTKAKEFTKVKVTVESNVKAIAAEITELAKLDTKCKHTVVVSYVTADGKPAIAPTSTTVPGLTTFNRGGLVSMPQLQAFARGGSVADYGVFGTAVARRAAIAKFANGGSVSKVPGSGNSDTVFSNLRKGDFILRKKPSELLELLAAQNAFTTPRGVGGDPSNQNAYTRARGIGGDPNNPNDLTRLRGFTAGATGVAGSGSIENAPVTKSADQDLIAKLRAAPVFERSSLLDGVMAATVNAQLAWIKKARTAFGPNGVDSKAEFNTITQGRAFAQSIDEGYARAVTTRNSGLAEDLTARVANGADAAFKTLAGLTVAGRFDGFATGGEADANIPALLTPGELHFDAAAVRKIGLANLLALNAVNSEKDMMQRFRLAAASFVNMPVPPVPTFGDRFAASSLGQSIERFNAGGAVSNSTSNANSTNNVTFSPTVTINAASDVNIKQTVRALLPEFKETLRREGINLMGKR